MEGNKKRNELNLISHLILLITMGIFALMLIVMNRILGWEPWMIPVIMIGTAICWVLHVSHRMQERMQTYVCGIFLMFLTFYYTVNIDTIFDSTALIIILVFLFAFQGEKVLVALEVTAGYLGMVIKMWLVHGLYGEGADAAHVVRSVWQLMLIPLAAVLAGLIAESWKNAEKEFQRRIDEVAEENNRANDFLANVSHEIRTPINAVMGLSSVLEKVNLPEPVRGNVSAISKAGHRVAEQIGDLLDFTEIDMGKLSVRRESYMINSLVNDLLVQLSFAEDCGLDLVIDMEAGIPAGLVGDGGKIRKILWHLITNGYKFTKEGGVYVHIYPVKRAYGINLVMEVKDTGTGMTQEQIEHIYEKFYQSDSGRPRTAGGLGLGISIVNGFVKIMGGVFAIESVPQEGTTVRVSIPQEVEDDSPCISIGDRENCVAAGFLGFMTTGNPRIRGYYMEMIAHLVSGLSISFHRVQSRKELEKLISSVKVSHLFVGTGEYLQNREYIDRLAGEMNVAVVADQGFQAQTGRGIAVLPKPFYGAQVANFLNHSFDEMEDSGRERMEKAEPVAPERNRYEELAGCGVNVGQGLKYCQDDRDFYCQLLLEYAKDNTGKVQRLRAFYENGNWKDYAIRVHAVKSTSKMIGADEISDTAMLLEDAAKHGNEAELQKVHPGFMALYQRLMEKIREVFGDGTGAVGQDVEDGGDPDHVTEGSGL